nr:hypothetical protein [Nitrospirota bacterium]
MDAWIDPLLPVVIPFLGAALGLTLWTKPQALKIWLLLVTLGSLATLVGIGGTPTEPAEGLLCAYLLPIAAFVSLLGQPPHPANRLAWLGTLPLLGLGLGVLTGRDHQGPFLLLILLGLLAGLIYRHRGESVSDPWWGLGTCGVGMVCVLTALAAPAPLSSVALLVTCAILLPLIPLQGGYVAALAGLPGNLPAFLAILLPGLGWHGLLTLLPNLPEPVLQSLPILALASALYGSLKALTQPRVRALLAYAGLAFFAIPWWYATAARTATPQASLYVSAVGLALSGLLLAWYGLRARYGDMDLRAISGLARPMPRFATVLSLLAIAAMGLPPFGVFSGFMGMLLAPSLPRSAWLGVVAIAWLTASWYILDLVQRLLFGKHRTDLPYEDLRQTEFAALLLVLGLLLAMGLAPSRFFESGAASHASPGAVKMESVAWIE